MPNRPDDTFCEAAIVFYGYKHREPPTFVGRACLQADAKQAAARAAVLWARGIGIQKPLAGAYAKFCYRPII